jgi:type 1 fimbria pilin
MPATFRALAVLIFFLVGMPQAQAYCWQQALGVDKARFTLPDKISMPANLAVGQTFASFTVQPLSRQGDTRYGIECQANSTITWTIAMDYPNITYQGDGSGVHEINGAGFGFRISSRSAGGWYRNNSGSSRLGWTSSTQGLDGDIRIELVKTAPIISARQFASGMLVRLHVTDERGSRLEVGNIATNNTAQLVPQTCSVRAPASVSLGRFNQREFNAVGKTSNPVPFDLNVACAGVRAKVHVTFSDPTNAGNTSDVLPLSSSSRARGLGIQLMYDNKTVAFGPDSAIAGNRNQMYLAQANDNTFDVRFGARYIQTEKNVSPGSANGSVTFTMSYQ